MNTIPLPGVESTSLLYVDHRSQLPTLLTQIPTAATPLFPHSPSDFDIVPPEIHNLPYLAEGNSSPFSWGLSEQTVIPQISPTIFAKDSLTSGYHHDLISSSLSEIDPLTSFVDKSPSLTQLERAEKERKLMEFKEAARRLEEELAVS